MLRTSSENDAIPVADVSITPASYSSQIYQFFSSWFYSQLTKESDYKSFAELKSDDPLFGQIYNACRKDGKGIHHIIANAAKLALSKEEYGASCYWYFGPEKSKLSQFAMLMIDPNDIEWLIKSKNIEYSDGSGSFTKIFGKNNIFAMKLGTKEWRDERNRHLKVLDGKAIANDLPKMENILQGFLNNIAFEEKKGKINNLEKFTSDYTLEVVAKTKLGVSHLATSTRDEISAMISKVSVVLANQTSTFIKAIFPFLDYFPFYYFYTDELKNLLSQGDVILKQQVIGPNKESILTKDSFITLDRDKKTMQLESAEILNKFKEFLVVGHETTAKLLLMTLMLLGDNAHQNILEKLRHEIKEFRASSPREWAKEDFDQMLYLTAVLHEALRLYPPVPIMVNKINKTCRFRDKELKPGDLVFISQRQTHRYQPAWGMDAEAFKPERFIDESGKFKEFSDYMFFPFGFNPRKCVGQKFALLEVKQLIAIIVSEYDIALEKEIHHPFPVESTFTMKIALENIPLYFEERKAHMPLSSPRP